MDRLRVLVIGHGLIGRQRAAAVHALSSDLEVELAGTVDSVERDLGLYDAAPAWSSVTDVDREAFDAAIIALPHDVAAAVAEDLLRSGRPVLIEKPLGLTAGAAQKLATLAESVQRPSFVGYNYRFLPHVRELFGQTAAGTFGRLRSIDMLIGHGGHPGSAQGWKLDPRRAGGGVLLDPGVHLLDLLLALEPTLTPEFIRGTRGFWNTGIEEDIIAVLAKDEAQATVRVSHIRWVNTLRLEVVGEDGYAILEGRGANYGAMTSRVGRRWAWKDDPHGRSQLESEVTRDFGRENRSLEDETEAVLRQWLGEDGPDWPRPCSMPEAVAVAKLVDDLYEFMSEPVGHPDRHRDLD